MQWWCAAQATAWTWSWQPYPGVWAFVAALAIGYAAIRRRSGVDASRGRTASFVAGLLLLWIALDWPVGALGAGYLASVHMVQFLLIALVAPPLLLYGLPPAAVARLRSRPRIWSLLRAATHPLVAILCFNLVVVATHWPSNVDRLMASQLGSFVLDTAWLGAGLLFWWPVVSPVPERRFPEPLKIGYLILNTVLNTAPYAFLTFGETPFYAVFELSPPVGGLSAREDQQLAGALMKVGGGLILWTAITVLFFRWWLREDAPEPPEPRPGESPRAAAARQP